LVHQRGSRSVRLFVFFARPLVTGKYPCLIATCCIAILAGLSIAGGGRLDFTHGFGVQLRTLAEFSLGALLYRAHTGNAEVPGLRKWAAVLSILFVGLAIVSRLDFLIVGAFACLVYYAVNARNALGRLLNSRPSVALGNYSYSIYLWHAPTHCAVMAAFAATGNPVDNLGLSSARLLLFTTTLVVIGLSAVNYQCFEKPMRRVIVRAIGDLDRAKVNS
jgi:peptidoglycan/LPS O-acetylase OafA/YrhL